MQMRDLDIPAVKVLQPKRFVDPRGYFTESYNQRDFDAVLPGYTFVQDSESYSALQYTVRGLHYQAPPMAQDKLVRVVRGRIFDVVVDIRAGSPTFGKAACVDVTADSGMQVFAPKGFLHGFMTLEPDTIVSYKVTQLYHKPSDGAVHWLSPELEIPWPAAADDVILSARDATAPAFSTFETPFTDHAQAKEPVS